MDSNDSMKNRLMLSSYIADRERERVYMFEM